MMLIGLFKGKSRMNPTKENLCKLLMEIGLPRVLCEEIMDFIGYKNVLIDSWRSPPEMDQAHPLLIFEPEKLVMAENKMTKDIFFWRGGHWLSEPRVLSLDMIESEMGKDVFNRAKESIEIWNQDKNKPCNCFAKQQSSQKEKHKYLLEGHFISVYKKEPGVESSSSSHSSTCTIL